MHMRELYSILESLIHLDQLPFQGTSQKVLDGNLLRMHSLSMR